jgi:hypothetical protein
MKPFTGIAVVLFALIALVQLLRVLMAWPVSVNGVAIPVWCSVVAFVVTLGLAVMLWREARK